MTYAERIDAVAKLPEITRVSLGLFPNESKFFQIFVHASFQCAAFFAALIQNVHSVVQGI